MRIRRFQGLGRGLNSRSGKTEENKLKKLSKSEKKFKSKPVRKAKSKKRVPNKRMLFHTTTRGLDRFPQIKPVEEAPGVAEQFKTNAARGRKVKRYVRSAEVLMVRDVATNSPVEKGSSTKLGPVPATGMPLSDGVDAFEKKLELVKQAKSSIVLSGNYCGGAPFDEILEAMTERLESQPDLKIVILSSPRFITKKNRETLGELKDKHESRFKFVLCGEKWLDGEQELKRVTNHTKGLVVDSKHCVMGGSGIEERFSYSRGTGNELEKKPDAASAKRTSLNSAIARSFRDLDFYLSGEKLGKQLGNELLHLAKLWVQYDKKNNESPKEMVIDSLLTSYADDAEPNDPPSGDDHSGSSPLGQCQIFSGGPEMGASEFNKHVLKTISEAKNRIVIDHLYFHPTEKIRKLLADKVNEGVKLTIVTNGSQGHAPTANKAHAPRSQHEIALMMQRIEKSNRGLVEVYEFGHAKAKKINLHKKVIVADNKVLAGSSNLGYKSLVTSSDHEINFLMDSEDFAEKTVKSIEQDYKEEYTVYYKNKLDKYIALKEENGEEIKLPLSVKLTAPEKTSLKNRFVTAVHRKLAWLIG